MSENVVLPTAPKCGSSDARNLEYESNFSTKKFFDSLISSSNPIILDVGAHRGETIKFFKEFYPDSSIFSFEPEPTNFIELQKVAVAYRTRAFNVAVGESVETCVFYQQDITHLGGLLPINEGSKDSLGYAKKAKNREIVVEKTTLDLFCKNENISRVNLLKIDVQGFEVGVLEGAMQILRNTECVTVEVSLYDFYGNHTSSLLKIETIMEKLGFEMWDISKLSKNPMNFRTDWLEIVYRNRAF
ncbi:MAG: FkbM family methyltransferase [Flavobacterium sp.]|nr:MAG: FkbM family methyltransferase [Flavobacterium sp.]